MVKKIVRTLSNVPLKNVRLALCGLKSLQPNFFSKPDLNNPDILSCYNATAENYNFDKVKKSFKDSIDVDLLDPFAGVIGEDLDIINNNLTVDKNKALEELDYSIDYFDQIDVVKTDKDIRFLKRKPKNFSLSLKRLTNILMCIYFWLKKLNHSREFQGVKRE